MELAFGTSSLVPFTAFAVVIAALDVPTDLHSSLTSIFANDISAPIGGDRALIIGCGDFSSHDRILMIWCSILIVCDIECSVLSRSKRTLNNWGSIFIDSVTDLIIGKVLCENGRALLPT